MYFNIHIIPQINKKVKRQNCRFFDLSLRVLRKNNRINETTGRTRTSILHSDY